MTRTNREMVSNFFLASLASGNYRLCTGTVIAWVAVRTTADMLLHLQHHFCLLSIPLQLSPQGAMPCRAGALAAGRPNRQGRQRGGASGVAEDGDRAGGCRRPHQLAPATTASRAPHVSSPTLDLTPVMSFDTNGRRSRRSTASHGVQQYIQGYLFLKPAMRRLPPA